MSTGHSESLHDSILNDLLSEDVFRPAEPRTLAETRLTATVVEDLVCKHLLAIGSASGRDIASRTCLPFGVLEELLRSLRSRQLLVQVGSAQLGDYVFGLTEQGRARAQGAMASCGYVGPAPVSLSEYVISVEAQTVRAESPKRSQLERAFADISIRAELFDSLGPAINSGAGLFLYGEPGNGKTTLARRITACFGQTVFIPRAIVEDGQIIKVYDAAYHEVVEDRSSALIKTGGFDQRWVRVRRPTVIVGGELTLDSLEIRHDPHSNVSEAPIQMKSNCGCLLIDDFGRQRVEPLELLNRWIVPLENRIDFLTLSTGKKIQIPFEQLIIFSTNLEPQDLVDEAFLRRIPYKIEITDPDVEEFEQLFQLYAESFHCEYDPQVVRWLLDTHYRPLGRAMRRCHPRDLLGLVRNYCSYNNLELQMRPEYFDKVVPTYFTIVSGVGKSPPPAPVPQPQPLAAAPARAPAAPQQAAASAPLDSRTQPLPAIAPVTPASGVAPSPLEHHVTEAITG
jgi:predicted ATPase with chaperone activity